VVFGREPSLIAGFIAIAINLALSFGLNLTADQVALLNALVVAGLAIIVRQVVTPVGAPQLPVGTSVKTPDGGTATVQ
jgi:hypothetical protein